MDNLIYQGSEHHIKLPSSREVTIRENTGEDEETLTRMGNTKANKAISIYISNIIKEDSEPAAKGVAPAKHIGMMKRNDGYYLLFKQRLINLGNELSFDHECRNCGHEAKYEVDCNEFERNLDLTDEEQQKWYEDHKVTPSEHALKPYPSGPLGEIESTLSSGKKIRFKILTLSAESKILDIPADDLTANSTIHARELSIFNEGQWVICHNARMFSSKEMKEIRGLVKKHDSAFDPFTKIKCPKCEQPDVIRIFSLTDFFYPTETL